MFEDIEGLPQVDPEKLKELREQLTVALADRTTVDVDALAASLAGEDVPTRVHAWMRVNTLFHPYAGCLRGPRGTLWERAGNALDRCLLAAALLKGNGYEVELVLGRISEAAAKAKVDLFMALPRPVLVEPPPPECGLSEAEQDALTALAARFGEAISAAQEKVSSAYMDMIQRLQADVADGRILEAERRFLDWAAAARKALLINPELLLAGLVSLPAEAGAAFRTCVAEDQVKLDALFKPWLDRRELRMRRRDAPLIERLARWVALQYSSLNQLLTQRWGGSLLHRILPAEGPRGVDALGQILLYRKRQDTRRQLDEDTDTLVKAILDALERADLMPTDPLDTYAQAIRRSQNSAALRYRIDGQAAWNLLDPEAPALGGELPWPEADTAWTGAPEALPEDWYHRVVFSVRVERRFKDERGYRFEDEISLNETLRSCEQVGVAIRFTIPPQPTGPEGMLSAALTARLTGAAVSRYVPTLAVGDRVVQGKPIEAVKEVSGIASALDEEGKFTDVIGDVTGIWLEAALLGPEGRTELPPRSMLDRYGERRTVQVGGDAPAWLWRAGVEVEPGELERVGEYPRYATSTMVLGVFGGMRVPERACQLGWTEAVRVARDKGGLDGPLATLARVWGQLMHSSFLYAEQGSEEQSVDASSMERLQRIVGSHQVAALEFGAYQSLLTFVSACDTRDSARASQEISLYDIESETDGSSFVRVALDMWHIDSPVIDVDPGTSWHGGLHWSARGAVLEQAWARSADSALNGRPIVDANTSAMGHLVGATSISPAHRHLRNISTDQVLFAFQSASESGADGQYVAVSSRNGILYTTNSSGRHQGWAEYLLLLEAIVVTCFTLGAFGGAHKDGAYLAASLSCVAWFVAIICAFVGTAAAFLLISDLLAGGTASAVMYSGLWDALAKALLPYIVAGIKLDTLAQCLFAALVILGLSAAAGQAPSANILGWIAFVTSVISGITVLSPAAYALSRLLTEILEMFGVYP